MSRNRKRNSMLEHSLAGARLKNGSPRHIFVLLALGAGLTLSASAQYPGRVDPNKSAPEPVLRSTAVLEYTGDYTKPIASRLIPVAVWDGERYQPGGLYMAQPMPLAVESGTQYELFDAGASRGLFDVKAAANVSGSWIAIGNYQKPVVPKVAKLRASKSLPQMMHDGVPDDGKPHFAHRPADSPASSGTSTSGTTGSGSTPSGSATSGSTAPATDPDKPTLHRRTDSSSSSTSSSSTSGSGTDTQTGSGSTSASSSAPPVDPDRPTLHRKTDDSATAQTGSTTQTGSDSSKASSSAPDVDPDRPTLHRHSTAANANDNGAPVSATTEVDPDRPRLKRGRPEDLESLDVPSTVEIAKLSGNPENLKLMAAVSDIKTRVPHSFAYSWSDPDDMKKAQAALEDTARNLLSGKPLQPQIAGTTVGKTAAAKATAAKPAPAAAKPPTTSHPTHRTTAKTAPAPLELKDEQFKAYELSFGSGATLVFSASSGEGDAVKYVTIIAQPDFNGTPQVIWKQVTSGGQLDVTPRMQLVDAVDTDADNRAELIFELAGKTDRQFAIYRVADHSVQQVFTTGSSE
jgi:hypothetical protein